MSLVNRACALALVATLAPAAERPRVGLVLGGGAALGLAHVGVIEWLEEHRIPVDRVAGTSMGGLVGAAYATGRDSRELQSFVQAIDWNEALRTAPAFDQLSYRRKQDRRLVPSEISFGLRRGLHAPAGLSAGHGVGLMLSRISSDYDDLPDFNALPIPFRCVATELVAGRSVVFERGRLFDALRSTMAIPGVFTPWKSGNQVFVDGGTLDNLPVDVARQMGAQVVVAVVLETPPIDASAVASIGGVAKRTINVMIADNERRSEAQADIVLKPRLDGFGSSDYDRFEEFRRVGYAAAEAASARLLPYALGPAEWEQYLTARHARRRPVDRVVNAVMVERGGAAAAAPLHVRIGEKLDRPALEDGLNRITGLGRYESADYRLLDEGGLTTLDVEPREKPFASPVLATLLQFDGTSSEGLRFGLIGRVTFLDLGGPGSEWRTDFSVGAGDNAVSTEYYWRPRGGRFFLAPHAGYDDVRIPFWQAKHKLAEYTIRDWNAGADAGWAFGPRAEWRTGFRSTRMVGRVTSGTLGVSDVVDTYPSLETRFHFEGQDSSQVPRRGVRVSAGYVWVPVAPDGRKAFGALEGEVGWAHPLNPRYSLLMRSGGGATPERAGALFLYRLGGTERLSALARNQLFGHQYFYTQGGLLRTLGKRSLLGRLYGAAFYEGGSAYLSGYPSPVYHNATVGLIGESFAGVVFFGASVGDKGEHKLFFRLGRLF
jgi:NTE family protein